MALITPSGTISGITGTANEIEVSGSSTITIGLPNSISVQSLTASAGISAGTLWVNGGATFGSSIGFSPNNEYIRNTRNNCIDFLSDNTGTTAYGLRIDMTGAGSLGGVIVRPIRMSDQTENGLLYFPSGVVIGSETDLNFGTAQGFKIRQTNVGLDTMQIQTTVNSAAYSGAVAIVSNGAMGAANRSPTTAHKHPNLYIYSQGSSSPKDYIRFEHDTTGGTIECGDGELLITGDANGTLKIGTGLKLAYKSITGNYTVGVLDNILGIGTTSSTTLTLPVASSNSGRVYVFKSEVESANITIQATSSAKIDGTGTYGITGNYRSVQVYCNGTNWFTY